jgi:hypothetical protein
MASRSTTLVGDLDPGEIEDPNEKIGRLEREGRDPELDRRPQRQGDRDAGLPDS